MATVADGDNVTINVSDNALLTVIVNGGAVRYENPVGTLVAEFSSDRTFGPLSAGSVKLTSVSGAFTYETASASRAVDSVAYTLNSAGTRYTGRIEPDGAVNGLNLPSDVTLFGASRLNYRKAIAKVLSGSRARMLVIGDSTTVGAGAGTNGTGATGLAGARSKNWPTKLAAALTDLGIPTWNEGVFGDQNVAADGVTYADYDSRVNVGTWTTVAVGSFGAKAWTASASAATFAFTPTMTFDRFDVYTVQNSGLGTVTANVDGGSTLATINQAGSLSAVKTTVSCTRGTHTINIVTSSATTVYLLGIVPWDSTLGGLDIVQCGHWSGKINDINGTTNPYAASSPVLLAALAPDLAIIQHTINDSNGGTTPTNYSSSLATVESALTTAGAEVLFMSGIPSNNVATTNGSLDAIVTAMTSRASSRAKVYADLKSRCGSYSAMSAAGFMYDNVHGNAKLYADEGYWMAQVLQSLAR